MAANMYRVGDYVYFEASSTSPYTIRRIEELNKTPNGNVEAKVMCFYRRRDISNSLILLADKHHSNQMDDDQEKKGNGSTASSPTPDTQNGMENSNGSANGNSNSSSSGNGNDNSSINNNNGNGSSSNNIIISNNSNNNNNSSSNNPAATEEVEPKPFCDIPEKQRHQLKHRELFLSRQVETLPATHIRGKCVVTLLNETENLMSYLNKEDTFFYSLVYDPQQKTLLADKGEIRVGSKFQAEIPSFLNGALDERGNVPIETLEWSPDNILSKKEIDQFLVIARSVGTFARALDCTSTVRQPSLHMSAAAASRDITLFHAMNVLHKHSYDCAKAIRSLVPEGGPVLCRDEMEEWSASEANLFEEALDKYGKDFGDIRQDFLPWKSLKSIVEYYYMWKTTDRYVQQKRIKAAEAESKLKQVYIPNYNKPSPAALPGKVNGADGQVSGRACESCYTAHSTQWYSWGPAHMQCRLCSACWMYWKKYGGLKMPTRLDGERPPPSQRQERVAHLNSMRTQKCTITGCGKEFKLKTHLARHLATAHGLCLHPGSPRHFIKSRTAFCLVTTPLSRILRRLCRHQLRTKHYARCPFIPINGPPLKQECQLRLAEQGGRFSLPHSYRTPTSIEPVVARLGIDISANRPALLGRGAMAERNPQEQPKVSSSFPSIMKKRGYEQTNGIDGPSAKRPNLGVIRQAGPAIKPPTSSPVHEYMRKSILMPLPLLHTKRGLLNHGSVNGRGRMPSMRGSKLHMISWLDMPDDVFFVATDATRKLRKQLQQQDFKRAARNPWRALNVKTSMPISAIMTSRPDRSSPAMGALPSQEVVVLD